MIRIKRGDNGLLVLEDGTIFQGRAIGHRGETQGEVVVTTGMTGYVEVLTDPASTGQIVTFTYPLIGNYGITPSDMQSARAHARGIVVQESCSQPSNWRSEGHLDSFLNDFGIVGLSGIDTRALARHVRGRGAIRAVMASGDADPDTMMTRFKQPPEMSVDGADLHASEGVDPTPLPHTFARGAGPRVTVVDFGVRLSLLRWLADRGCHVSVMPATVGPEEVLATEPNGVVLSSGPLGAAGTAGTKALVTQLARRVPLFGVGLGLQIIAEAFGAQTYRLSHGHRGSNHPVKDLQTGRVTMTTQNHAFAVQKDSLANSELVVSHVHGNDGTVEGLAHKHLSVSAVQFYPEGSPGPTESVYPLEQFLQKVSSPV